MVADEGFEPTDVATFEVAAYASFANLRNCSSWSTTRCPPTTPLPFRCLSLVRCDEQINWCRWGELNPQSLFQGRRILSPRCMPFQSHRHKSKRYSIVLLAGIEPLGAISTFSHQSQRSGHGIAEPSCKKNSYGVLLRQRWRY